MSKISPPSLDIAKTVIQAELNAINGLMNRIDTSFAQACEIILETQGRVVVLGMGKSGHIANKIAATLASTGTPAFFVHPGEASHGDLGMITAHDSVLALSNSGETAEIIKLLPVLRRFSIPLISLCGRAHSTLAKAAHVNLDVSVEKEACPLNLAPTSSTTAALVMGDALAISLQQARGFTQHDFALNHPGGSLGRRLLMRLDEIMHTGEAIPKVDPSVTLKDTLIEMSQKRLGMSTVVNAQAQLLGVFTDGDVRRALDQGHQLHTPISDIMSTSGHTVQVDMLAAQALKIMQQHKITSLVVTNKSEQPVGIVHIHDLIKAGIE